jgi:hypothetical protein
MTQSLRPLPGRHLLLPSGQCPGVVMWRQNVDAAAD